MEQAFHHFLMQVVLVLVQVVVEQALRHDVLDLVHAVLEDAMGPGR